MSYDDEPGDGLLQYDQVDAYQGLGILVFQIATLPVWLPIWAYMRFVHRRPARHRAPTHHARSLSFLVGRRSAAFWEVVSHALA